MHQNTGDDDISFIGRGLFESLDSIGGGSSQQYQQQPQRPLSHSSSPLPSSSTPTTHHPYPSPHSRGNYFQDRTRFGDVSGEGRSRREDQPTQSTYDEDRRLQLNKPGGNPSMSFRDFSTNNGPEGYPDSPNALSFSATHQHPPQRIQSASSPGGFHPQLSQPEASTSSSSPTVLPFSTELELSNNLSPMYHPPGQHALPPDHLYQLPLLSNPQFPNSLQNHSFLQVQQQIPLSQRQQPPHLQNQSIIPIGIASSMGLPVGMGGVNPKLSQNGRVNAGSSRVGGRGEGEGQQGSGLSVGRELEEEISTIFVVGFPDDMQEREFQNMFTFCKDFEAATLKLPHFSPNANTAQSNPNMPSAASVAQAALSMLSNSSNGNPPDPSFYLNNPYLDPSVLDNYQDQGNSNSHGLAPNVNSTPNFNSNNVSARKQIIGFAKFKTKQAAMEARDALQGRKVDVERASVLKAEMAKKNLHTRRGVGGDENVGNGNGGMGVVSGSVGGPSTLGLGGHNVMNLMNGGMGRGRVEIGGGLPEWAQSSNPSPASATQRHFPNQIQQPPNFASFNMMQDPSLFPSSVLPGSQLAPHLQQQFSPPFAPAQSFQDQQSSSDFHSASSQAQPFPLSPPPQGSYQTSTLSSLSISDPQRGSSEDFPAFSPPMTPGSLQPLQQIQTFSLGLSQQQRPSKTPTPSSVSNPTYDSGLDPMSDQRDVSSENEDKEKRQEPMRQSSSSGDGASSSASSSFGKSGSDRLKTLPRTSNPADMNPPINTLYVGNLPTASSTTATVSQLEDSLRNLFSRCGGFRRMSFRQKSNGPMCFVEFEDIETASAALKEYYGNSLGGLVKGGIRLSFSKNSLGQRNAVPPPNNSGGNSPPFNLQGLSNIYTGNLTSPPVGSRPMGSPVDSPWDSNLPRQYVNDGQISQRFPPRHPAFGIPQTSLSLPILVPLPPRPSRTFPQSTQENRHSSPPSLGYTPSAPDGSDHPSHPNSGAVSSNSFSHATTPTNSASGTQGWKPSSNFSPFGTAGDGDK